MTPMHDALTVYFDGEKYAGLLLAGIGFAALAAAALMFRARADLRPFGITLGVLAIAQIALGVGLYLRTGPQVRRLAAQLASNPEAFYSSESPRMARVQRNFVLVEYVEVALIVLTSLVAVAQKGRPTIAGVALGILIGAAVLLAFDIIAERRGAVYLAAIGSSGP